MIQGFADPATEAVHRGQHPKGFQKALLSAARRKLAYLDAAGALDDMKVPPGNKLHPLTGDRDGQHAVWINDQYRLCFRWTETGPTEVEITDYH